MIDSKTLNSLDSMTKYKTYSKYNNVLDKKFKGYSLKSFVKAFKNPRQFVKAKFLEEFARKHPYENEEYIQNSNINTKTKNFLSSLDKKKPKKIIIDSWARKSNFNPFFEAEPDPFRYNPNYNSIYKNVPCCRIVPPRVQLLKNKNKKRKVCKINYFNRNNRNNRNKSENKSINKTYDELLMDFRENNKTTSIKENKKITKTLPAVKKHNYFLKNHIDKNNHAFKFTDYTPRKENKIKMNERISYIEPHDYSIFDKKKVMDFGRMQDRNKKSILINYESLGVPSSIYYNPKYQYTDERPAQTLFTHQDIIDENKKSNKFLIHKLWTSYNVSLHYQLIDNDKLNKKFK